MKQDAHIPFTDRDVLDWRKERDHYFSVLRAMRSEYMEEFKGIYDLTARPAIHYWAEEKYGFRMEVDGQGGYTSDYTVTDPKKFMLFKIKYWQ